MLKPITAEDSQLHFIVTSYRHGLVSKKDANKAIRQLKKARKEKYEKARLV